MRLLSYLVRVTLTRVALLIHRLSLWSCCACCRLLRLFLYIAVVLPSFLSVFKFICVCRFFVVVAVSSSCISNENFTFSNKALEHLAA